jgi:hypothetical protein
LVGEIDADHQGAQIVIVVVAAPEHLKGKVDLGRGLGTESPCDLGPW